MNANIIKTQILKSMTSKVNKGHKSSSIFSVNPTLPLLDGPLILNPSNMVGSLSLSTSFSLPLSLSYCLSTYIPLYLPLYFSVNINLHTVYREMFLQIFIRHISFHKKKYDLKGHMRPLLWFLKILRSFYQITTLTYVLMGVPIGIK